MGRTYESYVTLAQAQDQTWSNTTHCTPTMPQCAIFQLTGLFHLQFFLMKEIAHLSNVEKILCADSKLLFNCSLNSSYGKY